VKASLRREQKSSTTSSLFVPAFVRRLETHLAYTPPEAVELYNIPQDPSEKNNLASQNPDKVAELQKRANELAAIQVKPIRLQIEFQGFRQRLGMPPALPGEDFQMEDEK
jgi:hypothetical protein